MRKDSVISADICEARCAQLEAEDQRQNERIVKLESLFEDINRLVISTEKLATNMDATLKELQNQSTRIEKLENRDGEKWRYVVKTIANVVIGALVGLLLAKIGLGGV